jgi:hypothetical protein
MSKLGQFLGTPKEIEIKGQKLVIYPLKVKDLSMFKEGLSDEEKVTLSREIIKRSLNDSEVTDKEIEEMDVEVFMKLMEEINKLNGFEEDERIRKIKEKVVQAGIK